MGVDRRKYRIRFYENVYGFEGEGKVNERGIVESLINWE